MQVENHEEYSNIILPEVVDLMTAPEFKKALKALYEEGCNNINIDCSNLGMIDSAGIGILALYQKRLKERGGELKLVNVTNDYIKHLFEMIDLARVISIE